ncbi:MAG: hypothetical protein ACFFCW_33910 [Candidatus Hodarchaeota archaeon]
MDILKSKLLKDLSPEEKLELATRALCSAAHEFVILRREFDAITQCFQDLLQAMAEGLTRREVAKWTEIINETLNERRMDHGSSGRSLQRVGR